MEQLLAALITNDEKEVDNHIRNFDINPKLITKNTVQHYIRNFDAEELPENITNVMTREQKLYYYVKNKQFDNMRSIEINEYFTGTFPFIPELLEHLIDQDRYFKADKDKIVLHEIKWTSNDHWGTILPECYPTITRDVYDMVDFKEKLIRFVDRKSYRNELINMLGHEYAQYCDRLEYNAFAIPKVIYRDDHIKITQYNNMFTVEGHKILEIFNRMEMLKFIYKYEIKDLYKLGKIDTHRGVYETYDNSEIDPDWKYIIPKSAQQVCYLVKNKIKLNVKTKDENLQFALLLMGYTKIEDNLYSPPATIKSTHL